MAESLGKTTRTAIAEIKSVLIFVLILLTLVSCTSTEEKKPNSSPNDLVTETTQKETYTFSTEDTDTVTIDGVVYRNKFQGDLILRNPVYDNEPLLNDDTGLYFRLKETDYELIYNITSHQIGHPESVYCRDDQWQELKAYYSDTKNFTYQYITNQTGGKFETHAVDEMDINKLNELIGFCEKNSYDPFGFSGSANTRSVSTSSLGDTEYRFGVSSNDGLFSSGAAFLYILDNNLVLANRSVMSSKKTLIVDLPQELSDYFILIINSPSAT